jgi:predicted HD superfamily hydrolase involved in NAD metabolism
VDHRELRRRVAPELPEGLRAHVDGVVALADEFAHHHGVEGEARQRMLLAAAGHDLLRAVEPAELLARAEARGIEVDAVERATPQLLHGAVGAAELCERFGVCDGWVLDAVRWHTSGHPDFDTAAWLFFLADKVEPWKVERWPALQEVAVAARTSPQAAALQYIELNLERGAAAGWLPHPMAERTRDALAGRDRN